MSKFKYTLIVCIPSHGHYGGRRIPCQKNVTVINQSMDVTVDITHFSAK